MELGFFTKTKADIVKHPGRKLNRKLNGWEVHSILETQPADFSKPHQCEMSPEDPVSQWHAVILSWNLSPWKTKEEILWIQGQFGLYSEILFQK